MDKTVSKTYSEKLGELIFRVNYKLEYNKKVHTNPVEIGTKELEQMLEYLRDYKLELEYKKEHWIE
jgi:hypothetical protein